MILTDARTPDGLTLDDLEAICWKYGGTIETRPGGLYVLVGTTMAGATFDLGPVRNEVAA